MSPITAAARERLEAYVIPPKAFGDGVHDDTVAMQSQVDRHWGDAPRQTMLRQLIDNLIQAVRAEQPTDNAF